jgi:uncharacterized glyoxalase superfamily protein PhnB
MLQNRSMPSCSVIPVLGYPNVQEAIDWLCRTFGFALRLQIADHRAQLKVGGGCLVITRRDPSEKACRCTVMVRVEDLDRHYERALTFGARILAAPEDHPYGERQYSAEDFAGHLWTFSQSIADVSPEDWGGSVGQL